MLFSKKIKTPLLSLTILFDVTYYPNGIEVRKAFEDNDYTISPRPAKFLLELNRKLKEDMGEVVIKQGFSIFSGLSLVAYIYEFETKEQAGDYYRHNDLSYMCEAILRDKYIYLNLQQVFVEQAGYIPANIIVREEAKTLFTLFFDEQLLQNAYIQSVKLIR